MMIDFEGLFNSIEKNNYNQRKVPVVSSLGVYYGHSENGYLRLSFLSKIKTPKFDSTEFLRIQQVKENDSVNWLCIDLLKTDAKPVFYSFCDNLISSIVNVTNEVDALNILKKRIIIWKKMFKKVTTVEVSNEIIQGLFGELFFLQEYMLKKYSPVEAIKSWSGADSKSKDFSIENNWFEIKTIGANSNHVTINSLNQLSSPIDGHLVVIKVESMSDEFCNINSSIGELLQNIMLSANNEVLEEVLLSKIQTVVGTITSKVLNSKFSVKEFSFFVVNENFPRLTESNLQFPEIEEIKYTLNVHMLAKYREDIK